MKNEVANLAQRQQHLVQRIFDQRKLASRAGEAQWQGLVIYQKQLQYSARRSLTISYPVLHQLIGPQALGALAIKLLKAHPPASGDWADWGQPIPQLLRQLERFNDYPFLADLSLLEWYLHEVGRAPVEPIHKDSLLRFQGEDLLQARFSLSPSVRLLRSQFAIDEIWLAHQQAEPLHHDFTGSQDVRFLIVYQQYQNTQFELLTAAEFQWFLSLEQGLSINALLELYPEFDFVPWFAKATAQNWISNPTLLKGVNS